MLVLLFQWFAAHFFADFLLQSKKLIENKKVYKQGSWFLYVHAFIHAALIYLLSPDKSIWLIPVIVFVSHYSLDLWKLYRKDTINAFILDQVLHISTLVVLWLVFYQAPDWGKTHLRQLMNDYNFWLIATGYLVTIFPLAFIVGYATQRWRKDIEESFDRTGTSLSEAGKWIGMFERILVFTFVINNHFEGIGFLIAAKSILRFNDIKGSEARKEAEYVLIGTLMSFAASIITGIITVDLMK